eukprot:scaffold199633_cov22-Tisochrysis_lutea.AAC.1
MSLGCPLLSACMRRQVQAGPAVGGVARAAAEHAVRAEQEGRAAGDGASGTAKAGAGVREADSSRMTSSSSSSSSSSRSGTGVEALVWGVLPVLQTWIWRACGGHGDAYKQCSGMFAHRGVGWGPPCRRCCLCFRPGSGVCAEDMAMPISNAQRTWRCLATALKCVERGAWKSGWAGVRVSVDWGMVKDTATNSAKDVVKCLHVSACSQNRIDFEERAFETLSKHLESQNDLGLFPAPHLYHIIEVSGMSSWADDVCKAEGCGLSCPLFLNLDGGGNVSCTAFNKSYEKSYLCVRAACSH